MYLYQSNAFNLPHNLHKISSKTLIFRQVAMQTQLSELTINQLPCAVNCDNGPNI